jgi:galactose mutarotase-like enzyme
VIELVSGEARLTVAESGAEARGWRIGATELLWPGDASIWPETAPILFPVVGWTRDGARVGGKPYALGLHGFARRLRFVAEQVEADFVRMVVSDDEETRAVYPFPFRFAVEHRLKADTWEVALEVCNTGDGPMPYACGLHPGFNWPFGSGRREGAAIRFAQRERAEVPDIAPGGLIAPTRHAVPLREGRVLPLDEAPLAADAVCFLDAASRALAFEQADGSALEMTLDGFAHIALWTRPPAPYLCLESWTGYSDPEGFAGDLFEKPSMTALAPGASARHAALYRFQPRSERA